MLKHADDNAAQSFDSAWVSYIILFCWSNKITFRSVASKIFRYSSKILFMFISYVAFQNMIEFFNFIHTMILQTIQLNFNDRFFFNSQGLFFSAKIFKVFHVFRNTTQKSLTLRKIKFEISITNSRNRHFLRTPMLRMLNIKNIREIILSHRVSFTKENPCESIEKSIKLESKVFGKFCMFTSNFTSGSTNFVSASEFDYGSGRKTSGNPIARCERWRRHSMRDSSWRKSLRKDEVVP